MLHASLSSRHLKGALLGTLMVVSVSALTACSKPEAEKAGESVSSAASEASSAVSDVVVNDTPQEFVNKVTVLSLFEIESSKLALKTSKDTSVKALAETMIKDHTAAGKKLKTVVAADADKTLVAPKVLDEDHQKKLDEMKALTGEAFDKAYISAQKDAHSDAMTVFDGYSRAGTNAALATFANETLPVLMVHKDLLDKM
jgi:putative membrane protein